MADMGPYYAQAAAQAYGRSADKIQEEKQHELDNYTKLMGIGAAATDRNVRNVIFENANQMRRKEYWDTNPDGSKTLVGGPQNSYVDPTVNAEQNRYNDYQRFTNQGFDTAPAAQVAQYTPYQQALYEYAKVMRDRANAKAMAEQYQQSPSFIEQQAAPSWWDQYSRYSQNASDRQGDITRKYYKVGG